MSTSNRGSRPITGRAGAPRRGVGAPPAIERISGRARVPTSRPEPPPRAAGGGRGRPPRDDRPPALVRRRRPRWGRIAIVLLVGLLLLAGAGAGAVVLYARGLDDNMGRTEAFSGLDERPEKAVEGSLNILLLGSDSRDPDADSGQPYRADTIMLMHIPAAHDQAYLISIPRDLWVPIPVSADGSAGGTEAKINAATAFGGVPLMVQTVESYTGVRLDHVMMIDFGGFVEVTDALGGVEMDIPETITSIHKPNRTFEAGRQELDGEAALDYIRQRYQFADGDFTRMRNQQQFLRALLDKAASTGTLTNPGKLNAFLQTITETITVDEDFSLVSAAWQFRGLRSDDLRFLTNPNQGTGWVGNESVVLSDDAAAADLYQAVREDRMAQWATENPDEGDGN